LRALREIISRKARKGRKEILLICQ
jgi:hypothetical protein